MEYPKVSGSLWTKLPFADLRLQGPRHYCCHDKDGASLVAQMVNNMPAMQETQVQSLGREDLLEKGMLPTPVFLPEESHGQRSLVGYSPWGRRVRHDRLDFHSL